MEISLNILLAFAVALLCLGTLLLLLYPSLSSPKGRNAPSSVTVSGGQGIITVRNAAGGDLQLCFSERTTAADEHIVPSPASSDIDAEREITILDELRSPDTPLRRKAEIESELSALGYRIVRKPKVRPKAAQKTAAASPSEGGGNLDEPSPEEEGDEALEEQEPLFESFHYQDE